MDADLQDQRTGELEAENAALGDQARVQAERILELEPRIGQLQNRIKELERDAARRGPGSAMTFVKDLVDQLDG